MKLTFEVTKEDWDLLCSPVPAVNPYLMRFEGVTATGGSNHRRFEAGASTEGPRESQPQEVRGRHCHRRSEGGNIMEVAGPQEVHRVHSRSARRPDTSGSHSRSISDPIRSSGFLPSLVT